MKTVKLVETTLSRNQGMSFKEKLETARILDSIHVDVIETCAIEGVKANEILVKSVSQQTANSVVSCPVLTLDEVEGAFNAVKDAKKARLNVKLPVSVVQMEYLYKKKPAAMLEMIKATVERAASLLDDVEFTALDATRAEEAFLIQAIEAAVQAGAKTVTVLVTAEQTTVTLTVKTDKETLGAALYEYELVNDASFFDTLNGIKADWDANSAYWAFYVGDDYASVGVNETAISGGETFKFVYTTM